MSAAEKGRSRGKLAIKLSVLLGLCSVGAALLVMLAVIPSLAPGLMKESQGMEQRAWLLGGLLSVVLGAGVGLVAYTQGSAIASRLTDLALAIAKLGRGTSEVRVRYTGNDEVASLGRGLHYLAADLAAIAKEAEQGGGMVATTDKQVRAMRDLTLTQGFPAVEGFEVDGSLSPGSRGGLDYFDCLITESAAVMFLVSAEGAGALSVVATRMARDELMKALKQGVTARKALSHANRVLNKHLPQGVCATACLLELRADEAKVYQAGYRSPVFLCARGAIKEVVAEGIALGLDEGPVFEKGLRSATVTMGAGTRVALVNEAGLRLGGLEDLIVEHSPMHTAPFMNMVLGKLEAEAGEGGLREDVVLLTAKKM